MNWYRKFAALSALLLAALLAPLVALGDGFLDDDLNYDTVVAGYNYSNIKSGSDTRVYVSGLKSSATSVTIPATVVYEWSEYVSGEGYVTKHRTCTVTGVTLSNSNQSLLTVTIRNGPTGIYFKDFTALTSVDIPSSVTSISFRRCTSLTNVNIPSSVTIIGFDGCSSLTSVSIPSSVTNIGGGAFQNCTSLASVTMPGVTSIGFDAFRDCSSLASVSMPSVMDIGIQAFYNCSSLESVTIPSSVTNIGIQAFYNCSSLASATVPQYVMEKRLYDFFQGESPIRHLALDATVSAIHQDAFSYSESLTTIEVDPANTHYFVSSADGCLYDIGRTTLLCCPRNKTSITIPYGVTKIANYAFAFCSNLVSVTMPSTLREIGNRAFFRCASLSTVAIPDSVTNIDVCAFANCRNLSGVTIPSGVTALSTTAFDECAVLWTEWYRALANLAVNGSGSSGGGSSGGGTAVDPRYALAAAPADRTISTVTVDADCAIDSFVLTDGKVYDTVLRIVNTADHAVTLTLPSGYSYERFKGTSPLTIPANSANMLTITRTGDRVFFVTREELESIQ